MPITNFDNGFDDGVNLRGMPVLNTYSRRVFWVDSNAGANTGDGTFDFPYDTIDYAIGRCTANKGDIIMVKAGHTETVSAAAGIDVDVAGVSIVGLGNGEDRPVVTFTTSTAADLDIDAANVTLKNLVFKNDIDSQTLMIDVNADDFTIEGCEFREGSSKQCLTFIDVNGGAANACDRARIVRNTFISKAAGAAQAIELGEVADQVLIEGNLINGDWSAAGIHNPTGKVLTNLTIRGNYVRNDNSGSHAIELVSACTGTAHDNRLVTDASTTAFDAGALSCMGNLWNVTTGGDTEGTLVNPVADTATNFIGADDSNNAAATTNVTANGDGSVLERLELLQQAAPAVTLDRNAANYLSVTADFTSATWNTAASHEIATVTGGVHLVIVPEVTGAPTSSGSSATLVLGDETTSNSIIASTDAENLATGEVWFDSTDTRTLAARSIFEKTDVVVMGGKDIGYTIGNEALTGGSIVFHMWWWPITATGAVAAGAGGSL